VPTGGTGGTTTGTGTTGETNPDSLILSGWEDFNYGAYSSAVSKFNQVLTLPNLTDTQKAQAYNGLGWAQAKSGGLESAYSSFSQAAATVDESKVGLAAVLIQRGQKSGFSQAVSLLESVGLGNTAFTFQPTHKIGVSNPEAHAMLAFAYFWRDATNDRDKAKEQILDARAKEGAADSSVAQIYNTLAAMGLFR